MIWAVLLAGGQCRSGAAARCRLSGTDPAIKRYEWANDETQLPDAGQLSSETVGAAKRGPAMLSRQVGFQQSIEAFSRPGKSDVEAPGGHFQRSADTRALHRRSRLCGHSRVAYRELNISWCCLNSG